MVESWVTDEMEGVDLEDKRLNHRLTELLSQFGGRPTESIPAACGGYAETAAAYRFFDNDKVRFDNVLQPHIDATRRRMAQQPVVILAQDTTEIDLTRPQGQVAGTGPLDRSTRRGVFFHPLCAFTPDGTPLGTVHAKVWVRPDKPKSSKAEPSVPRKRRPIEGKESYRWIEGQRAARLEAQRAPQTQFVLTSDSEADIYELLAEAQAQPHELDWIVRACQDRALAGKDDNDSAAGALADIAAKCLREQVLRQDVLFTKRIKIRGRKAKISCDKRARRQPRQSRRAKVQVRAAVVTLRPPHRPDRTLPPVAIHVVSVREIDPPANEAPVEWILLTSLPIDTPEQVSTVIDYYCVRWMIEIVFRTLKSGCRVEKRRFEHVDRLLPCLAVYLIITWRTLYVCRLGRAFPGISCEAIFAPCEWKPVCQIVRGHAPPSKPPSLSEMVRMVAQLGGYVNRKRPDEPGPQTVWLGLERLHDIALCWQTFGPEAKSQAQRV